MNKIYFDHSATTPVDPKVLETMLPYFSDDFGNASSIHGFGQKAAGAVDEARRQVAGAFACEPQEVIFTSGATEANNLAVNGLLKSLVTQGLKDMHVITTQVEHDAIIEPCRELVRTKLAEVTYLGVKPNGVIDVAELEASITDKTVLVSVMFANSEVGAIQPIKEIGKIIKKINEKRLAEWETIRVADRGAKPARIYFHTDATQAVNFLDCNIKALHVDMLSMSGHKIYGPKGVGALIVKEGTPISAILRGGHQERNFRSGTLNVPGIVGLGEAVSLAVANRAANNKQVAEVRDYLIERINKEIPQVVCNTDVANATPSHAHFSFVGAEGESVLLALDMEAGIAVSTGSACASHTLKASRVLLAMGIKQEDTHGAIRFTLGKENSKADIDKLMEHLPGIVKKFRDMAPAY
jgi:cysteine desulfurase